MNRQQDNVRRIRRPAHEPASPGRRLRANWPAEMRYGGTRIPCHVIDISIGGAKLKVVGVLPDNSTRVWLVVGAIGPIAAEPVWRKREMLGLRFLQDQPEIARLQMRRFDAAAWLEIPAEGAANITNRTPTKE